MFRQVLPAALCAALWRQLLAFIVIAGFGVPLWAQVCPTPGNLVTGPTTGIVNNYYEGNGNLAVGATSLTLGARDTRGRNDPIAVGDLLMIIQMQDASISTSNNSNYGGATGTGAGSTSVGRSGLYEFVRVVTAGASPVFTPPLSNSYIQAAATTTQGQRTYQVIRAMQYSALTAAGITSPAWNGKTGGVVSIDVRDTLTLGSGTVESVTGRSFFVAGKGFRGGAGVGLGGSAGTSADHRTLASDNTNGSKAEGIAGTPLKTAVLQTDWAYRTTNSPTVAIATGPAEGYPDGSYARGAPGNAGGGGTDGRDARTGNDENAGGGGGGNYGPGGIGGRPWNDSLKDTGGRGGAGYAGTLAFNRVFLGGGGGAGGTNNATADPAAYTNQAAGCSLGTGLCSSGAAGGGIVIIRARAITGAGVIDVRGAHAYNVFEDAGGGGGAGGSVVIQTSNGGSAIVDATGGDGGNAWAGNNGGLGGRHGPGGAGGGGFIAYAPSSMSLSATVNGGAPGQTMANLTNENYGSTGYNGGLTAFLAPNVPGAPPAAQCDPNLSLVKSNGVNSVTSGSSTTYTLTVSNAGLGETAGTVTVSDKLPTGLSVATGTLVVSGPAAASWSCNAANNTDITCSSNSAIAGGGSSSFAITASVTAAGAVSLVNRAIVKGGGDPNKPLAATPADGVTAAAACTGNGVPAGCALDTDTVVAPNLVLTKTDNTTTIVEGNTTTYTLVVSNTGSAPTSGTITVVDVLPTGLTFGGLLTTSNFTCVSAAPNITCRRTTALAAGASATITFRATIASGAPSAVTNLARVGGGGDPSALKPTPTAVNVASCSAPVPPATTSSDPNTGCAGDTDEVRYVSLQLTKDDGQPFMARNGFTDYVIVVSNIGTADSFGTISVRDVLPGTVTFVTANTYTPPGTDGANWSCTRAANALSVLCTSTVPIPAGGNSSFTLRASVNAATVGSQVTNRARVGGGGDISTGMIAVPSIANTTACISNGNPAGCATDLDTVQNNAEIRLAKSHANPQAKSPGNAFVFNLVASNSGGTAAPTNSVRIIDTVPAGLTITAVTAGTPFTCSWTAARVVTCNNTAGALAAGSLNVAINVSVTVLTGATNTMVNRAFIGNGVNSSGDPQNNQTATLALAQECTGTGVPYLGCAADTVPLNADLQITKLQRIGTTGAFTQAVNVVPTNSTVQFLIRVANSGPSGVSSATIADVVPTNFSNVTWVCGLTTGSGSCGTASGSGNEIELLGTLAPSSSLTITVTARATSATPIGGVVNMADVTPPTGIVDSTPTNNSATVTTSVGAVNLSLSKTDNVSAVQAGTTTTYTITVNNSGDYPANGARLLDTASSGLSCTGTPVCVASGPATACPAGLTIAQLQNTTAPAGVALDTFGAGGSMTITLSCSVRATGF